ncbi:MAG: stage II sporulation protein P [Muribaculaceae bacterium]|nr:stage II sporulation protein P [Alistipes senegalensis]MCM1473888.1 stage II sporulation protein P [Muribaculaceae bacterium]
MTRHKRRKIAGILRICALLLFPVIITIVVKSLPAVKNFIEKTGSIRIESHDLSSDSSTTTETFLTEKTDGLTTTTAKTSGTEQTTDVLTDTVNPLEMTAENSGDKPYPTSWTAGGAIVRTTYGQYAGNSFFNLDNGGQVNNQTSIPNETLLSESRCAADFTVEDTGEPLVLIYHTHTTESFEPYVRDFYDANFNYRTTDETKNMIMVGDAIQAELEAQGIGVIHARDIHDYPSYNGSYGRSRETILPILEQYPSIKVVLDIHRDAVSGEGTAYQPFIEIDGKEAAQIMIISGCDDGTLGMPNFMKNFHFACRLQEQFENDYSGFTRPVLFDYRHYNQDLTTGSLLIEVGSHGNTLEQVQYSGQLIGSSLGRLLNSMKG